MNLKYISDSNGTPRSVIIPIEDWNRIKDQLNIESHPNNDWYDSLSDKDKKNIEISLQQADNGNTIHHHEVRQKINNKINKLKNS